MATKKQEIYFIVSRQSQDNEYAGWTHGKNGLNTKSWTVLIRGGANVIDSKTLETPKGVITKITAEEFALLKQSVAFNKHVKGGWLSIHTTEESARKAADAPKLDKDGYVIKDGGAQKTRDDYVRAGLTPPVVGAAKIKK